MGGFSGLGGHSAPQLAVLQAEHAALRLAHDTLLAASAAHGGSGGGADRETDRELRGLRVQTAELMNAQGMHLAQVRGVLVVGETAESGLMFADPRAKGCGDARREPARAP